MEKLVLYELLSDDDSSDYTSEDKEYMYRKKRLLSNQMIESDFISHFRLKSAVVNNLIKEFEKQKFQRLPGVIGCLDGSHIKVDRPIRNPDSYYNRKTYFSIHMQGICNHQKKFIDVYIGYTGSIHDARVFRNSHVIDNMRALPNGRWVLGDSAYPCLKFLLTAYRDNGYLSNEQTKYNKVFSSTRIYIEHVFGILKQRFRQLYHLKLRNISLIVKIIKACCVLHNMGQEEDLQFLEVPLEVDFEDMADDVNENSAEGGQDIRQEVTAIINSLFCLYIFIL
ncbi:hypothetical protein NQ314_018539 [Rhamnusium bicolor]|uniref:DDE Tnp4 domain-containing protein n=1 Tax=Rhamnusium bicolor TaxID=1586634 RepID=A0AAV8WRM4_9CUCU|nr:hypothetical protein NQ314_018539 [Rhamnusium bicolor]